MRGKKVRLKEMHGEPQMEPGLEGEILLEDDAGQIHVKWENGSTLALVPAIDSYEIVDTDEEHSSPS